MSVDGWQERTSEPEMFGTYCKFTGNGVTSVVKNFGRGVTFTRTGVGVVNLVFDENMGNYVGITGAAWEATTIAALKGYTMVAGVYTPSTRTLTINITNNADTLTDLAVLQQVGFKVYFKRANA